MRLIVLIGIAAFCGIGQTAENEVSPWKVTFAIDADRMNFVIHEPVPLKITWKNISTAEKDLRFVQQQWVPDQRYWLQMVNPRHFLAYMRRGVSGKQI